MASSKKNQECAQIEFENFLSNYKKNNPSVADHKVFEHFCALKFIPKLHSEFFYSEDEEYLNTALTNHQDKGIDISYENIIAQCKYTYLKKKDDILLITSKLKKEIQGNDKKDIKIHVYLFCKNINPEIRNIFEKESFKDNENLIPKVVSLYSDEAWHLIHKPKNCAYINLNIRSIFGNDEERKGGMTNLFQGKINGNEITAATATISANNLINALNQFFAEKNRSPRYRDLFSDNIRTYLDKKTQTNKGIKQTIKEEPEKFIFRNNGIVVLCKSYEPHIFIYTNTGKKTNYMKLPKDDSGNTNYKILEQNNISPAMRFEGIQIINGAQTIGTIIDYYVSAKNKDQAMNKLAQVRIVVKVISGQVSDDDREEIIRYHNTQNPTVISDFYSKSPLQKDIQKHFENTSKKIYYQIKRGCSKAGIKKKATLKEILTPEELVTILLWTNVKNMSKKINQDVNSKGYKPNTFLISIPITIIESGATKRFNQHYKDMFEETDGVASWSENYAADVIHFSEQYKAIKKYATDNGKKTKYAQIILPEFKEKREGVDKLILSLYASCYYHLKVENQEKFNKLKSSGINNSVFKSVLQRVFDPLIKSYTNDNKNQTIYSFTKNNIKTKECNPIQTAFNNLYHVINDSIF